MSTYVIGDLHGYVGQYIHLLRTSSLCDEKLNWTGGTNTLWLIGDFFDRGASGIDCLDLTIKLQRQARDSGGNVSALLGNHELMILCAYRFPHAITDTGSSIIELWVRWGGIEADLEQFTENHAEFIQNLPAMALQGDTLLIHADAMVYVDHGISITAVNKSFQRLMLSPEVDQWIRTLEAFAEHMAFSSLALTGGQRVEQLLKLYGGKLLVHGHTPIPIARGVDPTSVTSAWEYSDGRCLNVDGGIYMGSPGFVHQLD